MNNLLGQFEWKGPQELPKQVPGAQPPSQQQIIKQLHQELMVKELRIRELESQRDEFIKALEYCAWELHPAQQSRQLVAQKALRTVKEMM